MPLNLTKKLNKKESSGKNDRQRPVFKKSLVFKSQRGKAQPDLSSFPFLKAGISWKDVSAGEALAVLHSQGAWSAPQHHVKSQAPLYIYSFSTKEVETGFLDSQSSHGELQSQWVSWLGFGVFCFVLINLTQTRVAWEGKKNSFEKKMIPLDWHVGKFVGSFSQCGRCHLWAGSPEIYKKADGWGWRDDSALRTLAILPEGRDSVPSTHMVALITNNSSPRGSGAFFWPPQT